MHRLISFLISSLRERIAYHKQIHLKSQKASAPNLVSNKLWTQLNLRNPGNLLPFLGMSPRMSPWKQINFFFISHTNNFWFDGQLLSVALISESMQVRSIWSHVQMAYFLLVIGTFIFNLLISY